MSWFLKVTLKIIITKLHIPYKFLRLLGLFRHGRMDNLLYPIKIFNLHILRAYPEGAPDNLTYLELGPGDSIASSLIAAAHGAKKIYLVDVNSFATKKISYYQKLASHLNSNNMHVPDISDVNDFEMLMERMNAEYITKGLEGLKTIPSNSVDFLWSHSVLEHIHHHEVRDLLNECHRIIKPNGICSHNVDFQDHLNKSLNNLRFPTWLWESKTFQRSGFYTNRIPAVKLHSFFESVGFTIIHENFGRWEKLPLERRLLHHDFECYSDDELRIRTSSVLLRPNKGSATV